MRRYLENQIRHDLKKKMVFVGGPRQVGKTTLAKQLLSGDKAGYLSWDIASHREKILKQELPTSSLWVFDEIHKYRSWRNYLKGVFDEHGSQKQILVTGSAKLDVYRRGGDSLQGRYHYLRLHPLSVKELDISTQSEFMNLLELGGFPEPFFSQSKTEAKRWSREYRTRLIREEITSLEQTQDLGNLELLYMQLPKLVGSPLSINSLREDLQVSHPTLSKWINIFERLYAIFRLAPFGAKQLRAVKKEQKHYHFDWSLVQELSARYENLIACHLLKWCHFQQDALGQDIDLQYYRDTDKREVDFVITNDREPIHLIECKWKDESCSSSLVYLKQRFPQCQAWQLTCIGNKDFITHQGIHVMPALSYLRTLL